MSAETVRQEIEEVRRLKELLSQEKAADFEYHRDRIKRFTPVERRKQGYAWLPVEVVKTGYMVGERISVTVARTKNPNERHLFRAGAPVLLTPDLTLEHDQTGAQGVVHFVKRNEMRIILNTNRWPEWLHDGLLAVELLFDERTYLQMEAALDVLERSRQGRIAELRAILYGNDKARWKTKQPVMIDALNQSQCEAIQSIVAAEDVAIVHGPPGTGKTTTLVHAIKELTKIEKSILVCAPSNAAVDVLTERIAETGLNVVRLGNISRVDERLLKHTLDQQISDHPESSRIKKVRQEAEESFRMAGKFKRKFGAQQRNERQQHYREARQLLDWARHLEDQLVEDIISSAHVICCTLINSTHKLIKQEKFHTVVIDEAGQALEPACWIPILRTRRVIMAGDPYQLPPTIKSNAAARAGLNISLLEKAMKHVPSSLLKVQYRMNAEIMGLSNKWFYDGQLQAHESVATHRLFDGDEQPFEFVDTAGCGFEESINEKYLSRYNQDEANLLREHLLELAKKLGEHEPAPSIAILTPYREQAKVLRDLIDELDESELGCLKPVINTIDAFQGQERDIIYISLVRSNTKGEVGFLKDYRRMNVALTRARKKLIVIGDSATLGQDDFYSMCIDYVESISGYRSAWEYMSA